MFSETKEIHINSSNTNKEYWQDLWRHRGLLTFLIWRDLVVKYKQTAIGISWVFIKAILNISILSILFGSIFRLDSNGIPYSLVVLSGMLVWQLFANVLADTSNCLSANGSLLSKVYFPRLILPINILLLCLVDFLLSFILIVFLLIWNLILPTWNALLFPFFVLLAGLIASSLGMIVASLSVRYRDIKQLIPFILQIGMYVSPVAYLTTIVPDKWKFYFSLNPLVGVIDGFRWSLLGSTTEPYWNGIIYSILFTIILFYFSILIFRNAEKGFVDSL